MFTSLTVSVIPESACRTVCEAVEPLDVREAARLFMSSLSPLHRDVFVYLIRYVVYVRQAACLHTWFSASIAAQWACLPCYAVAFLQVFLFYLNH